MKHYIVIFLICFTAKLYAQSANNNGNFNLRQAGNIILPIQTTDNSIATQVNNWKTQIALKPDNENAWFNYYLWTDRDKTILQEEKQNALAAIVSEAKLAIASKPLFQLIIYLQSDKKDTTALLSAFNNSEDKKIIYPYLIQHYIIHHSENKLFAHCKKYNQLYPLSEALLDYHSNVLLSADRNAIIYAKGLNDLVPMAIAQKAFGVRSDIRLAYFDKNTVINEGGYLCLTMGKDVLSKFKTISYTGLLAKVTRRSTLFELKKNIEHVFDINTIQNQQYNEEDVLQLHKNYLPAFIILYKYYVHNNDEKQYALKKAIENISERNLVNINKSIKP